MLKEIENGPLQVRVWNPAVSGKSRNYRALLNRFSDIPWRSIPPNAHYYPRISFYVRYSQHHDVY